MNRTPTYTLDELLAQMTPETFHDLVDFGPDVGGEVTPLVFDLPPSHDAPAAAELDNPRRAGGEGAGNDPSGPQHPSDKLRAD